MKSVFVRLALGVVLGGLAPSTAVFAEEAAKSLPTLLIKGEVVSVDTTDPAATLLKVKDRYGFETPIFLTQETKITQGDAAVAASVLTGGTAVEVEYNFDINTAKRHAVSVKVAAASQAASTPAPAPTPSESAPAAQPEAPASTPAPTEAPSATPEEAPATAPATQ